jgi:protein involved in polysaccharide export with SLBB domain
MYRQRITIRPQLLFQLGLIWCGGLAGCIHTGAYNELLTGAPRELEMVTHPEYRVAPPDILLIESAKNIRAAGSPLRAGDQLLVQAYPPEPFETVANLDAPLESQAELELEKAFNVINGVYQIGPEGDIDLGPNYGKIVVGGVSEEEARERIVAMLQYKGFKDPLVRLELADISGKQVIAGEHLVRPDGTISLGVYGSVHVAGLSLEEAKSVVEAHLSQFLHDPEVNVDVVAYNSQSYYVITDGGGFGERVDRFPVTGNETVLDAIAHVEGLSQVSSKNIWIARPAPAGAGCAQILPVNWREIAAEGVTTTNYQVLPGDRIYIKADPIISLDNIIAKITAPVERVFGVILLGDGAVEAINSSGQRGGGF